VTGGDGPTGIAMDRKNGRLYVGCGGNGKFIVMDSSDGKILATLPMGPRCDGVAFDSSTGDGLAACGDGTIAVARETSDGKFEIVQTVQTKPGARTIAVDEKASTAYLPAAEFEPAEAGKRPTAKAGTFQIVVVAPK
jgi:DNA-binding beta-propeller fold protein YncE